MSVNPIMSYGYPVQPQKVKAAANTSAPQKAPEAFEGEAKMLKSVYDNYIKNAGGFQEINGQKVHVTTVLHINKNAQQAVLAIENRLRELGELPPAPPVQYPSIIY